MEKGVSLCFFAVSTSHSTGGTKENVKTQREAHTLAESQNMLLLQHTTSTYQRSKVRKNYAELRCHETTTSKVLSVKVFSVCMCVCGE